jgi:hypothetical protein
MKNELEVTVVFREIENGKKFKADIEFALGDKVKYGSKQSGIDGTITGLKFCVDGGILYEVAWSDREVKSHYGIELKSSQ